MGGTLEQLDFLSLLTRQFNAMEEEENILFDVEFRFAQQSGESRSIRAHKLILSILSPVFKKQFFGALSVSSEKCEIVEVLEFSCSDFSSFLQLIYGDKKVVSMCSEMMNLFQFLRISDKYQTEGVTEMVKKRIERIEVGEQNLIEILEVCSMFEHLLGFETICSKLFSKCCVFVRSGRLDPAQVFSLMKGRVSLPLIDRLAVSACP